MPLGFSESGLIKLAVDGMLFDAIGNVLWRSILVVRQGCEYLWVKCINRIGWLQNYTEGNHDPESCSPQEFAFEQSINIVNREITS
jgi:hypothetical protein